MEGIRRKATGASVTFNDGTDKAAAAVLAAHSQVAIVIVGNHPTCNAGGDQCALPSEGKEAIDRQDLTLPEESLVKAVLAANSRTVVVLQTSFPNTTSFLISLRIDSVRFGIVPTLPTSPSSSAIATATVSVCDIQTQKS